MGSGGFNDKKGKAAKDGGYLIFLVPNGEKTLTEYGREKECESIGSMKTCNIDYVKKEIDIQEEIGINVTEVKDITEALNYML